MTENSVKINKLRTTVTQASVANNDIQLVVDSRVVAPVALRFTADP